MSGGRVRESRAIGGAFKWHYTDAWFPQFNSSGTEYLFNFKESFDSLHPGFFTGARGSDSGGNCSIFTSVYSDIQFVAVSTSGRQSYVGDVYPAVLAAGYTSVGEDPPAVKTEAQLIGLGATGLSRTIPTNPSFGLTRAIGEIRNDGLPAIVGMNTLKEKSRFLKTTSTASKGAKYSKQSGNEFLNVQFGWLPLVSDLRGMAKAVKSSNQTIAQFQRSADVHVRRKYKFPSTSTEVNRVGSMIMGPSQVFNTLWNGAERITSHTETSFSGAFLYHVPMGDDLPSKMIRWEQEANKLLGLRLTPKLVWDLAPWTWAIDWFSNMGDVMNNASRLGADGLVMEYGFVTDKRIVTTERAAWTNHPETGAPLHCSLKRVDSTLERRSATWYGFNFDLGSLSATQEAVVVALGLSHGLR